MCLYEPCFVFVTHTLGSRAAPAILRLTLVAGFASPLSFVAGAWLANTYSWQVAVYSYAARDHPGRRPVALRWRRTASVRGRTILLPV